MAHTPGSNSIANKGVCLQLLLFILKRRAKIYATCKKWEWKVMLQLVAVSSVCPDAGASLPG